MLRIHAASRQAGQTYAGRANRVDAPGRGGQKHREPRQGRLSVDFEIDISEHDTTIYSALHENQHNKKQLKILHRGSPQRVVPIFSTAPLSHFSFFLKRRKQAPAAHFAVWLAPRRPFFTITVSTFS
ncbi:hypothetical protein [Acanthopleuribacter pedis]|uniref:Uncharacterized protein n=1 Tax=Acanthopleuribacter pedis TaxID=442870 RepID=A0A8J7U8B0_9BACT|nr:hypothetical protein [Acanthopleuribacter pedis]MBO1322341.1 hypothetical protein [Acanthopleuribacter pedis]